jgi:hypothetical protein
MQNFAFCSSKCPEIRSRGMGLLVAYRTQKKCRFCPVKKRRDISLWKISVCTFVEKYRKFSASPSRGSMKGATINGVTYEAVAETIYLGTLISFEFVLLRCVLQIDIVYLLSYITVLHVSYHIFPPVYTAILGMALSGQCPSFIWSHQIKLGYWPDMPCLR